MDNGPWKIWGTPRDGITPPCVNGVWSGDFTHDVQMRITGDFADDDEMWAYCEWVCEKLNAT